MEPTTNGTERSTTATEETVGPTDVAEVKTEAVVIKEENGKKAEEPAVASTKTEKPNGSSGGGKNSKRNSDRGRDRSRDRQAERERQRRSERSRGNHDPSKSIYKPRSRPECRVYISNIPYEHRWQDLKDLFRAEVGEVSFVELFEDETGKPRGCGIIEFEKREHALTALEKMNGYELKGRRLVVKEDLDVERDTHGRLVRGSGGQQGRRSSSPRDDFRAPISSRDYRDDGPRRGGGSVSSSGGLGTLASRSSTRWHDTYGLSPQFLESLGITGALCPRVFIANLDYKVDDAKLREVFRLAGQVVIAEVTKDRDGRSRGFGVVEFDHPVEAVQAISMFNNQMLFDRRMTVRMDRDAEKLEPRGGSASGLPAGLRGIGMGLGAGGNPIHDLPRMPDRPISPDMRSGPPGMGYGNRGLSSVPDMGMPLSSGRNAYAGAPLSSSGMGQTGNGTSSLMTDYGSRGTGYSYSSSLSGGVGSNGSNGALGSSGASAYGYSTDGLSSARGSSMGGMSDYERRDAYDPYVPSGLQAQQPSRDRQPEYRPSTSAYDLGTRMAPMGSSTTSSLMDTPMDRGSSRISDTIVINNLPLNWTWQDLRDKFCEVGDVLFADIRSQGTGLVRFGSERDAQRAVSVLHRARMDGKSIEVDFY